MAWSPRPAEAAAVASARWGRAAPLQVKEPGGSSPGCAPSSTGCEGDFNKRKASFVVLRSGRDPCKCFILPHRAGVIWGVFQHCCWLLQLLWLGFIIHEDTAAGDYWQRGTEVVLREYLAHPCPAFAAQHETCLWPKLWTVAGKQEHGEFAHASVGGSRILPLILNITYKLETVLYNFVFASERRRNGCVQGTWKWVAVVQSLWSRQMGSLPPSLGLHPALALPAPGSAHVGGDLPVACWEPGCHPGNAQVQAIETACQLCYSQLVCGWFPGFTDWWHHQLFNQSKRLFLYGILGLCTGRICCHIFW